MFWDYDLVLSPRRVRQRTHRVRSNMRCIVLSLILAIFASSAFAKDRIINRAAFLELVLGKTLGIPLLMVRLRIYEDGSIQGKGMGRQVSGLWEWESGYFCRTLVWGSVEIGRNCQEVTLDSRKLIFTSDRGTGRSARFSLK